METVWAILQVLMMRMMSKNEYHTELHKLSEDDKPGLVMGTMYKTVHQHMERFRLKQMKLDESTQQGRGDTVEYFHEKDREYCTAKSIVPVVVQLQTAKDAAASAPTTFGERVETLNFIPGKSQMLHKTPQPGCSLMSFGSGKPCLNKRIASLLTDAAPDSSPNKIAKAVETATFYTWIEHS